MEYNKETGDVKIIEEKRKAKRIIQNTDDLERERNAVLKEVNMESEDLASMDLSTAARQQEIAEKLALGMKMLEEETQLDPTKMFVFGKDYTRIDLGLIISRPAIFMHMHDRDAEFLKARADIMNEYHCDHKKYIEEFEEVSKLNEHVLSGNPYSNDKNLDNYPTHKYSDPATGETMEYAAASKNFAKVDPET